MCAQALWCVAPTMRAKNPSLGSADSAPAIHALQTAERLAALCYRLRAECLSEAEYRL